MDNQARHPKPVDNSSLSPKPGQYQPLTIVELGRHIANCAGEEDTQLRWLMEFIDEYRDEPLEVRVGLLMDEPAPTGDIRWDALLAGLAEYFGYHDKLPHPLWTNNRSRFLEVFWFLPEGRFARADALVNTPASFRRRGVFVTNDIFRRA